MKLYEIQEQYLQLLEIAEDPDVDPQVIADTMEGIEGEFEDKADGYAKVIAQLTAEADALKKEADRITARKKAIDNSIGRIKDTLQAAMVACDKRKFKTTLFSFGIQKNPASVVITDENRVAHDFLIPQPPKIDKKAIKNALDEGFCFDWAHLEQGESLRIR